MLVTEVPGTPDSSLPLLIPQLPNAPSNRWVADTVAVDGAAPNITDIIGGVVSTGPTPPVAGVVDGLRGLTYDGVDDRTISGINLGSLTEWTAYAVMKFTAMPTATKVILDGGGGFVGVNTTGKLILGYSGGSVAVPTSVIANQWFVVAGAVKVVGAGTSIARIMTNVDIAGVEGAAGTYTAFGNFGIGGASGSAYVPMVAREFSVKLGTAHTLAQMATNVAALKAEYGIV